MGYNPLEKRLLRENIAMKRGIDPEKEYTITFYGVGDITDRTIDDLAHMHDEFIFPIKRIYLVGRDTEASEVKREHQIKEKSVILAKKGETDIISRGRSKLKEVLKETDLFLFAAYSLKNKGLIDRVEMAKNNLPLVKEISADFKGYKGQINFISNLPEALAQYAAAKFQLYDPRQVTAHVPLDQDRYNRILKKVLKEESLTPKLINQLMTNLQLTIVGYHEFVYPVLPATIGSLGRHHETGIQMITKMAHYIEGIQDKEMITESINIFAKQTFILNKQYHDLGKLPIVKGPTTSSTGSAVADYLRAVINGEQTTLGIPFRMDGEEYYFVNLPVDCKKGYPEIDKSKFNLLDVKDIEILHEIIYGKEVNIKGREEHEFKSLEQVIKKTVNKNFKVPDNDEAMSKLFNPGGYKPRKKEIIEITIIDEGKKPMEKKLVETLNAEIYLKSSYDQKALTRYVFKHEYNGRLPFFDFIVGRNVNNKDREKLSLEHYAPGQKMFVIGIRDHTSKEYHDEYYTIFDNNHPDNLIEMKREKQHSKILDVAQGDKIYILKETEKGLFLEEMDYNFNSKIKSLNHEADLIRIINGKKYFISMDNIYNEDKLIYTGDIGPQVKITKDIIGHDMFSSEDKIIIYNKNQGQTQEYECTSGNFDLVQDIKGIQMAILQNGRLTIYNGTPEEITKGKADKYNVREDIFPESKIFMPARNILFVTREPDEFYTLYHEKGESVMKQSRSITQFKTQDIKVISNG